MPPINKPYQPPTPQPSQAEIDRFSYAARDNEVDTIKIYLAKYGRAIINCHDSSKDNALTWAVWSGHKDLVIMLLNHGANIEDAERDGRTPLMCAVQTNKPEILKLLLERGADVHARTADGRTALTLAKTFRREDMVEMIEKHIADAAQRKAQEVNKMRDDFHKARIDKLKKHKPPQPPFKKDPPKP